MRLLTPESLREALAMLAAEPDAVPMAGGTDLLVDWPDRLAHHDRTYIDLSGVDELRGHRLSDEGLVIGGTTTYWDIIADPAACQAFPLLEQAARQVGAVQIQTRGTWAGNVVNASPAADGVPVLMAYDATIELVSAERTEVVPLQTFYRGYKEMNKTGDQLVRAIRLPRRAYRVERFRKVGSRRAQAITKVGFALTESDAGWRVVANSVAPTVCRCPSVEALLRDRAPLGSPDDLLPALDGDVAPIDDLRSTAAYRRRVLARILFADLLTVCPWLGRSSAPKGASFP